MTARTIIISESWVPMANRRCKVLADLASKSDHLFVQNCSICNGFSSGKTNWPHLSKRSDSWLNPVQFFFCEKVLIVALFLRWHFIVLVISCQRYLHPWRFHQFQSFGIYFAASKDGFSFYFNRKYSFSEHYFQNNQFFTY